MTGHQHGLITINIAEAAVNSLNRRMGQPDLYPLVLSPPVLSEPGFVHQAMRRLAAATP
jgi:hypothetical protein